MTGFSLLTGGLIGQWLLGVFIAATVLSFRNGARASLTELAGLGCVLGVGATSLFLFAWSYLGGMLGIVPSGLLTAAGILLGTPILFARIRQQRSERSCDIVANTKSGHESAACRTLQVSIAVLFVACILQTLQTPQKLWDERAIFALKAKVLFEDRTIHSAALSHPDWVQYHPRYPLLLPLAEAHIYALIGAVDDRLSKIVFPLLYCGLILSTAGVLARHLSQGRAWLGALILATVPVMMPYEYGFVCGQADAPVACFHGLSVLYLWEFSRASDDGFRIGLSFARQIPPVPSPRYTGERVRVRGLSFFSRVRGLSFLSSLHESRYGSAALAGILAGLAAFTKDEGIAYLIVDTTILGLFSLGSFRSFHAQARPLIVSTTVFAVSAIAILTPWFLHRRGLPHTTEMNYFGRMTGSLFVSRMGTLGWTIPHLGRRMFWEWQVWGLQWWLMLAGFVARPFNAIRRPQLLLILDVAGALASLLVAGMLAPAQLDEHIGGSSHRFLMQLAPVGVLFAVTQFFPGRAPTQPQEGG